MFSNCNILTNMTINYSFIHSFKQIVCICEEKDIYIYLYIFNETLPENDFETPKPCIVLERSNLQIQMKN